ncbi:MAG: DegT/DnrJ/EryC1/StrS family aminotransferase [Pseudomonadota bacterium]
MIIPPEALREDRSLAIHGGREPRPLPYEDTGVETSAADAVAEVVRTGRTSVWRGGPRARELEARFAALIGREGAFFHNSGSAALITGLHALGADEGSTVALACSGFVSAVNAVYHTHARPVFLPTDPITMVCERDPSSWVAEPIDICLVTQLLGNVVDIDGIMAATRATWLLEDASQALMSTLNGRYVGARGHVSTFAASSRKLMCTGQGGMNVYDDPELGERMRRVGHHGKAATHFGEVPGFNFRGGEMEATLGLAALERLAERAALRNRSAQAFKDVLASAGIPFAVPPAHLDCTVTWFDTAVLLPDTWLGSRDWLVKVLLAEGVPGWTYPSLIEMPWVQPWMRSRGWWGEREDALLARERALWGRMFVLGSQMSPEDARRCGEILAELITR